MPIGILNDYTTLRRRATGDSPEESRLKEAGIFL